MCRADECSRRPISVVEDNSFCHESRICAVKGNFLSKKGNMSHQRRIFVVKGKIVCCRSQYMQKTRICVIKGKSIP